MRFVDIVFVFEQFFDVMTPSKKCGRLFLRRKQGPRQATATTHGGLWEVHDSRSKISSEFPKSQQKQNSRCWPQNKDSQEVAGPLSNIPRRVFLIFVFNCCRMRCFFSLHHGPQGMGMVTIKGPWSPVPLASSPGHLAMTWHASGPGQGDCPVKELINYRCFKCSMNNTAKMTNALFGVLFANFRVNLWK